MEAINHEINIKAFREENIMLYMFNGQYMAPSLWLIPCQGHPNLEMYIPMPHGGTVESWRKMKEKAV